MQFVYDFDSTLFSLNELWEAWIDALSAFGKERDEIVSAADPLFETASFNLENHGAVLGLSGKPFDRTVKQFSKHTREKAPQLVFSDVLPHLEKAAEDGFRQSILTFGHADYQHEKIDGSGIGGYIDEIFIARADKRKPVFLRELVDQGSSPVIFIEDNPRELHDAHEAGLPITLIRMRREGMYHSHIDHPGDDVYWPCIDSLEEIETYL